MAKEKLTIDKSPTEVRGSQATGKHVEIEATDGDVVYVADAPTGRKSQLKDAQEIDSSVWLSSRGESVVTVTTKKK